MITIMMITMMAMAMMICYRSCDVIFEDPVHMEFFQRYLVAVNAGITSLLFYIDVNKLKEITNPAKHKQKIQEILNTYFKTIGKFFDLLHMACPV